MHDVEATTTDGIVFVHKWQLMTIGFGLGASLVARIVEEFAKLDAQTPRASSTVRPT